ncbi:MAG: leucine-rich repeat protein, partial [Clostridia bacterium]|nr:leucine-rich repeat protein [Clostridia bacterium]
ILSCSGVLLAQNTVYVTFDYNTPAVVADYGGNFANVANYKKGVSIPRNSWFNKFPSFINPVGECLTGWVIKGTSNVVDNFTTISGDVTLQAQWDEAKINEYFGNTTGLQISGSTVVGYNGSSADVVIPQYVVKNNQIKEVTTISARAFENNSTITSISIPNTITSIGSAAFLHCFNLNKVYITDIATWCNITFDDSYSNPLYHTNENYVVAAVDLYVNNEKVVDLVIPDGVTKIKKYAFMDSLIKSVTIPDSVEIIDEDAFDCYYLTIVNISPNSKLKQIKSRALNSQINDLYIPSQVIEIESQAFGNHDRSTVIIDSPVIANSLVDYESADRLLVYLTGSAKIYIKTGLDVSKSHYLTSHFTKQDASDKAGYDVYLKN